MQTFTIAFQYNNEKVIAHVTPVINENSAKYEVRLPSIFFTIQPGTTETNHLLWVDDKDENLEIYQAAGEAIEKMV